jgi:hypothetical protein
VDESTLFGVVRHSSPPTGATKHRTPWEKAATAISAFDDDMWDPLRRDSDWTQSKDRYKALTLMRSAAKSTASWRVRFTTAPLAAQ